MKAEKLDFWIRNNYNVLFVGKHGVGKTAMIKEAFDRAGLKWKYFSASTMDPWVDFVGVPREVKDDKGGVYLDLVRPKDFQNDEVEAIFFDEFNRSHKKVRNAVMELLQFGSINGKKFKNLRMIWAAVNPADDEKTYDVDKLDPAQEDRFHIQVEIPCEPNRAYFVQKYGSEWATNAIEWWKALPKEQKETVSPRRLDYALDIYRNNGDLRDVLKSSTNISKLVETLKKGLVAAKLRTFYTNKQKDEARAYLAEDNNFVEAKDGILANDDYRTFYLPLVKPERLVSIMKTTKVIDTVVGEADKDPGLVNVINDLLAGSTDEKLINLIKQRLDSNQASKTAVFREPEKFVDSYVNVICVQDSVDGRRRQLSTFFSDLGLFPEEARARHELRFWNEYLKMPENIRGNPENSFRTRVPSLLEEVVPAGVGVTSWLEDNAPHVLDFSKEKGGFSYLPENTRSLDEVNA